MPDKWWPEIHILARRMIEAGDYRTAHDIAARHQQTSGAGFASAEWLLGWLNLRYLDNPAAAYRHFDNLYRHVTAAVSRARAAYWAGRAAEALREQETALAWHKIAAHYPSTFYGQLSYLKIHGRPQASSFPKPALSQAINSDFRRNELVQAIRLLGQMKMIARADPFFIRLLDQAKTGADYLQIAHLAKEVGRITYAVEANKRLQQSLGGFLIDEGYPQLSFPIGDAPDRALVHAIIHRESMFDPSVRSHAGALGLMQLMPATARMVARQVGQPYQQQNLTANPRYNVTLGSRYLNDLLKRYRGYMPMAIAAYNAGPQRVDSWIALFGDPRTGAIDPIDWAEKIPIYETRNYVQRVMESYFIYQVKNGKTPQVLTDFSPQTKKTP